MEKSKKTPEERIEILDTIKRQSSRSFITHHSKKIIYIVLEGICYLFVLLIIFSITQLKMETIAYQLGQLNPNESGDKTIIVLQFIASNLKLLILLSSLFPLTIALLLRKLRIKNDLIRSIYDLAKKE
jgi:hypothetical protein